MRIISINVHYQDKLGYQDYYLGLEWKKMGHEVHFISSDIHFDYPDYDNTVKHIIGDKYVGSGTFLNDYNVPVHRLKGSPRRYTGLIWLKGFERKLLELKPELIVSHGIFSWQSIRLLFIYKKLNCPIIFDDHTTLNLVRKGKLSDILFWVFRTLFAKRFMKVAHKLVGISETCIDVMRDNFGLIGNKVEMIPLGTDVNIFKKNEQLRIAYRNGLDIKNDEVLIVYTGKMYEDKKVHLIFEALNDEIVFNEKIVILLVGDVAETYKTKLDDAINKSRNRVIIKKSVSIDQLPAIYNVADISVWPDHTTNSTIDASACGCAIICSHFMPERVKYQNGIMIEGGNLLALKQALTQLINNKNLRNEMGIQGEKYVISELSWNAVAKKIIA
jgi:glycosyltransferase involved in cell wall biosynthesis